jgi:uncharacterized protein YdeI (YjbR/CyaY-like superfamily)
LLGAALDSASRGRPRAAMTVKKLAAKTKKTKAKPRTALATATAPAKTVAAGELPILLFKSPAQFKRWLSSHHSSSPGIWLRLAKKSSGLTSVSYQEALDVALAWGWIDGQLKTHDEHSWLRKFIRRSARSIWSKINRDKALALIASGQMQPPGFEQVERAKRDGRWKAAYDSPSNATVPPDLAAALDSSPRAAAFFKTLEARNRYAVLFRVHAPKRAETRARKVRELVRMLERGEKIHP